MESEQLGGGAARVAVRGFRPDVPPLDIRVPRMSGPEATAALRATGFERRPVTHIVVVTTLGLDEHAARALGPGVDGPLLEGTCSGSDVRADRPADRPGEEPTG
ncbi:hypothetical protein [Streptomyces sp. G-G2]|uniref:hypothetical protein n=1 Tax=Streptomyces sp. G-G2 TaxID=3046201 RepID=UPI0024BB8B08|nr:hypothetical protein [Streptomyces sp. G-G2]MDJ0383107.1 hypothetical protein [Streptomyces sp. G-G2]